MSTIYKCLCKTANINSSIFKRYSQLVYKSAISLDNIYPNSTNKLRTFEKPPVDPSRQFSGFIPIDELEITYSRSSGPGGQNVNKVNTKVDLRFNVSCASWLTDDIKTKLLEKYHTKITKEGYLVFRSDLTRSQQLNLADCLEKVRSSIREVCAPIPQVSEETAEKIRRRNERAIRERLMMKRQRSHVKTDRQSPNIRDM